MNGRLWTDSEVAILRETYASTPSEEIAARLGCDVWRVYAKANKMGMHKNLECIKAAGFQKGSTAGEAFRFKKGQKPANAGTRRPGFHAGRMKETQFKKGGKSANWQPVGSIRTNSDGVLEIKVREGMWNAKRGCAWKLLNREIWERQHGPIPPGHVVIFKDGNNTNCAIENLELISMVDNMRRNSIWTKLPRELAQAIVMNSALKRRIRGKEQNQRPEGPPVRDAGSAQG